MHKLTSRYENGTELWIKGNTFDGLNISVKYKGFKVESEKQKYKIKNSLEYLKGNGQSAVNYMTDQHFSTKDQDNDNNESVNCGEMWKSGWWFNSCFMINLNGVYSQTESILTNKGIIWQSYITRNRSLKGTKIMLK